MTIEQLSRYLDLSKGTIYQKTHARSIPHIKRGKKLYFEKSKIDDWLIEGRRLTVDDMQDMATKYTMKNRYL
jgi:excisionase family DNA binding protein